MEKCFQPAFNSLSDRIYSIWMMQIIVVAESQSLSFPGSHLPSLSTNIDASYEYKIHFIIIAVNE